MPAKGAHDVSGSAPDLLVIGGGVIGLAIAWRVAQQGLSVVVADPDPGSGASHAAAGMLTPVAEAAYAERELFELGLESLLAYPRFVAELTDVTGLPTGFRQTGTLLVGYDADDLAMIGEHAALRESFGVPSEPLSWRDCRRAEPLLGPSISGGLLVSDDASVDPRLLVTALFAAALKAGAEHRPVAATRLLVSGDRATGAELADGTTVLADQVVLAAGWASARLAGLPPDVVPPVRPVKGQIIRLGPTQATLAAGLPASLVGMTVRGIVQGSSVYLVPRERGELVIGATQEELGTDTTVTAGGVWQLLRDARAIVPGITELELAEVVAGLRPGTPDNAPLLGPTALDRLIVATGHFRSGVLLTPVTADVITQFVIKKGVPKYTEPFAPSRFARTGTGVS
jgi:glycine oxidase